MKGDFPGTALARVLQYAIDRHQFQRELVRQDSRIQQMLSYVPAVIGPAILSATIAAYLEVLAETHADMTKILSFCDRLVSKRSSHRRPRN